MSTPELTNRADAETLVAMRAAVTDQVASLMARIDAYDATLTAEMAPGATHADARMAQAEGRRQVVESIGRMAGNMSTFVDMLGWVE